MMLTQQENNKLKERDEKHTHELREWRGDLAKKRQVLMLCHALVFTAGFVCIHMFYCLRK